MPFGTVTLNDGNEVMLLFHESLYHHGLTCYVLCVCKFPVIAFGTGSTMKYMDVTDYVGQAIENGFSHIDTAQCMSPLTSIIRALSFLHSGKSLSDRNLCGPGYQGERSSPLESVYHY
jgi:hypothetical protein